MDTRTEALTIKLLWRKVSSGDFSCAVDLGKEVIVTVPKSVDDSSSHENSIPPTLPEQLVFLTAASLKLKDYVTLSRCYRGKSKVDNYVYRSGSYLSNKELAMIGELDGEEAEIIYKGSQESGYKHPFFEGLVHSYNGEQMRLGFPPLPRVDHRLSSYKEKRFFDEHIVFPDKTKPEYKCILEDRVRREMLARRESYMVLLEEAMMTEREKKNTEILARATYQSYVTRSRCKSKADNYVYGSGSYLRNKELAMIGELDAKEAKIIYKGSQESYYKHPFFEGLVHSYNGERMRLGFPRLPWEDLKLSSYKEKRFFDKHIVLPDITEPEYECILEDQVRREMLVGRESYVVLLEEAMMTKREKKNTKILARATDQRFPNFVW